jgi:hypothetical protein
MSQSFDTAHNLQPTTNPVDSPPDESEWIEFVDVNLATLNEYFHNSVEMEVRDTLDRGPTTFFRVRDCEKSEWVFLQFHDSDMTVDLRKFIRASRMVRAKMIDLRKTHGRQHDAVKTANSM